MIGQAVPLIAMALLGAALAGLYFGGLWLTVRELPGHRHPMLWLLASAVIRLALLLGAFYLVVTAGFAWLLACIAGFLVTRTWLLRSARWSSRDRAAGSSRARASS